MGEADQARVRFDLKREWPASAPGDFQYEDVDPHVRDAVRALQRYTFLDTIMACEGHLDNHQAWTRRIELTVLIRTMEAMDEFLAWAGPKMKKGAFYLEWSHRNDFGTYLLLCADYEEGMLHKVAARLTEVL